MKRICYVIAFLLTAAVSQGQYNPTLHNAFNKPLGIAQGVPVDARSVFYDSTKKIYRLYQNTAEVLGYLNTAKWRQGNFPILINVGGTLNANGTFTGGTVTEYWFQNGTAGSDLVAKNASILSQLSGKLNILDTIGMRPRLIAGPNIAITGTYPNVTIESTGTGGGSSEINSGTVAQLQAMSTATDRVYFATDRGGGAFLDIGPYDGQVEIDGALYLLTANNRVLKRQYTGAVDIRWFGADTLLANNSPYINAAIRASSAVYSPFGVFKIQQKIISRSGVKIFGPSKAYFDYLNSRYTGGSWWKWNGGSAADTMIVGAGLQEFHLDGIGLDGGSNFDLVGIGLNSNNSPSSWGLVFENFYIRNLGKGVTIGKGLAEMQLDHQNWHDFTMETIKTGFEMNSGNAMDYSNISNGTFMYLQNVAFDMPMPGFMSIVNCSAGMALNSAVMFKFYGTQEPTLIELCQSEPQGKFMVVTGASENPITLKSNVINTPIELNGICNILTEGNTITTTVTLNSGGAKVTSSGDMEVMPDPASPVWVVNSGQFYSERSRPATLYGSHYPVGMKFRSNPTDDYDAIINTRAGVRGSIVVRGGTYGVGEAVVPVSDNGHYYKCTVAGTTGGILPTFPTTSGATVTDGSITWQESGVAALFVPVGSKDKTYTISGLRGIATVTGTAYQISDFGGGSFLDKGLNDGVHVDNTGTGIISANGHWLERQFTGSINPVWFGAKGDGIANETQAIQATIDFASSVSNVTAPEVKFTTGSYRITGAGIKILRTMNVKAEGEVTLLLDGLTNGEYAFSLLNTDNKVQKASIKGFNFYDNSISGQKNGIFINTHDNLIEDNKFTYVNQGIKIDTYNGNIIQNNYFFSYKTGVYLYGFANETHINLNRFIAGQSTGTAAIKLNDASSINPLQNVYINENWFEANAIPNIIGVNVSNVRINGFWSEDYDVVYLSPRIDIDNTFYKVGNIVIENGRIVVKAGTKNFMKINAESVDLKNFDIHQDNEIPTLDLANSKFATLKNIRFTSIQAEQYAIGFGIKVKGGVNVEDQDTKDFTTQKWSVGGVQLRDGKNLFTNTTFNTSHDWVTGGFTAPTATNENATGVFDNKSLRVSFPANSGGIPYSHVRTNMALSVVTGDNVRVAFWAKTDGPPVRIVARVAGSTAPVGTDIYLSKEWKKFYVAVDSIEGGYYYLYLETKNMSTGVNVWIDDIQAETGNIKDFSVYQVNNSTTDPINITKGLIAGKEAVGDNEVPSWGQVKGIAEPFILRNSLGPGLKSMGFPNSSTGIAKTWNITGAVTTSENDSVITVVINGKGNTGNIGFTADGTTKDFTFITHNPDYSTGAFLSFTPVTPLGTSIEYFTKGDESFTIHFLSPPTAGTKTIEYLIVPATIYP